MCFYSQSAEKFISPLTFQSVTGRKAFTENDLWGGQAHVLHIGLGHSADLLSGTLHSEYPRQTGTWHCQITFYTITVLAASCPILVAPAMDAGMYSHPATQENVSILSARGIQFAGPVEGHMASGLVGMGRMIEPIDLLGHIRKVLGAKGLLAGKTITGHCRRNTGTH